MRKAAVLFVASFLTLLPVATAHAQYEGTNAKYAEKQKEERSNRRMIKLVIGGAVLVISGGIWAVKKMRSTT